MESRILGRTETKQLGYPSLKKTHALKYCVHSLKAILKHGTSRLLNSSRPNELHSRVLVRSHGRNGHTYVPRSFVVHGPAFRDGSEFMVQQNLLVQYLATPPSMMLFSF
jgi:hypothetical protein